jgi:hypothetical protein
VECSPTPRRPKPLRRDDQRCAAQAGVRLCSARRPAIKEVYKELYAQLRIAHHRLSELASQETVRPISPSSGSREWSADPAAGRQADRGS